LRNLAAEHRVLLAATRPTAFSIPRSSRIFARACPEAGRLGQPKQHRRRRRHRRGVISKTLTLESGCATGAGCPPAGRQVLAARLKKEISIFHRVRDSYGRMPATLTRSRYNPVTAVKYSVFASASPQAKFAGFSGGRIVPRCFPSGVNTQTPPGPAA